MKLDTLFSGPASAIICGTDRPLLNWVAYALASAVDPEFIWTDVRLEGEVLSPDDMLSRGRIPSDRMNAVHPNELALNDPRANVAVSLVVRADEPPANVQRLMDFLRLPSQTQQVLSQARSGDRPRVVVLSNSHRIVALYPSSETVAPTVQAIVESGVILMMTFADAPPRARHVFDMVLLLEGTVHEGWRQARLAVEKAPATSSLQSGSEYRLEELEPLATVLAEGLG